MTVIFRIAGVAALVAACATPPKPRELDSYDALRKNANIQEASKKSPSLIAASEKLGERAREEWQSNDLEGSAQ